MKFLTISDFTAVILVDLLDISA